MAQRSLSPSTEALRQRRTQQADEGRIAMAEYRQVERDRVRRMAELRRLRLEKTPHGQADKQNKNERPDRPNHVHSAD